ncbi:MAG: cytochrome c biogenesis protein CcsA [Luteolibacter sp.]|uniref:cytochrome c biogenesis protein n=1 Tax=Luteolibacter sp. TaxID=1962973 RepID=UPI003265EA68
MSNSSSKTGRWVAAGLATLLLAAVFYNVVKDNTPKGEVRQIEDYTPWEPETLKVAETIPIQNGGRIKPLSTYAGFTMLSLHGARSMEITGAADKKVTITPAAWLMDTLFRPELAVKLPTFRIDNSAVLDAIGVKSSGKRDRYSYADIEPGREKLGELAKSYDAIEKAKRDPVQEQTIALAYNLQQYERLLGYFGFARFGVILHGSGKNGAQDQRADISAVMATAPAIRQQASLSKSQGQPVDEHIVSLMEQVEDATNFSKFELFILPPASSKAVTWLSAGDSIYKVIADPQMDPQLAISDIKSLETTARSIGESQAAFREQLVILRDALANRAEARGEYKHIQMEADFYRLNFFLNALVFFILGTLTALAMWTVGKGTAGKILSWITLGSTAAGLALCVVAIVQRCIIMQRPPVGNLYDTIIFIASIVVLMALVIEWMTRRRFALGIAPITGTLLIILSRRFELGDAKDYMDPLVAVLNSNYWLTTHVLTITLGYAAGLLSAFLAFIYLLMRGLGLDDGDRDIRRSLTRAVYGMVCLTLFLALVGTVLGGIWANDSWGRFWGWDPKENGALLIVLWTLSILHARLGGYIREWGLHFAAVFTGAVVTFSWWHVNFLNTGLHNYGFTAGKDSIKVFYAIIGLILIFGVIVKAMEQSSKDRTDSKPVEAEPEPTMY